MLIYLRILLIGSFLFLSQISVAQTTDSTARLQLLFVGDVMGHGPQIRSAEVVRNESYDYLPCFQYLRPQIEAADLAIANLEVTLPGEPPYQGYPQFRSPDDLARALRLSGFDMLVTANNHSNDAGKKGVIKTVETVKDYGFYQTGTFRNAEERELFYPLIVYKNEFKLAFLNYTYGTNGLSTKPPTVVNEIDTMQMRADMQMAQMLQPDLIIVLMHWGLEYQLNESKTQNRLADSLFAWGADLIVGSHPHVVQPIKEHHLLQADSSHKKVVVAYSLGNFISNQTKPNTDGGLVFEIELLKDLHTQRASLGEHQYWPVWRYIHKNKKGRPTYHVVPISAYEKQDNPLGMTDRQQQTMQRFADRTRRHLAKFDSSERLLEAMPSSTTKSVKEQ